MLQFNVNSSTLSAKIDHTLTWSATERQFYSGHILSGIRLFFPNRYPVKYYPVISGIRYIPTLIASVRGRFSVGLFKLVQANSLLKTSNLFNVVLGRWQ